MGSPGREMEFGDETPPFPVFLAPKGKITCTKVIVVSLPAQSGKAGDGYDLAAWEQREWAVLCSRNVAIDRQTAGGGRQWRPLECRSAHL